eukprot:7236857-Alexandrium_andersonii.AAC.1
MVSAPSCRLRWCSAEPSSLASRTTWRARVCNVSSRSASQHSYTTHVTWHGSRTDLMRHARALDE